MSWTLQRWSTWRKTGPTFLHNTVVSSTTRAPPSEWYWYYTMSVHSGCLVAACVVSLHPARKTGQHRAVGVVATVTTNAFSVAAPTLWNSPYQHYVCRKYSLISLKCCLSLWLFHPLTFVLGMAMRMRNLAMENLAHFHQL